MAITKEQLEEYQRMYSQGTPLISDEEYDNLLEEYLNEHGESERPFLRSKQSSAVNDIVGTLPKVYGVTEPMRPGQKVYADWVSKLGSDDYIVIQPKFDGCSVAADLQQVDPRLYTRGDYDNGESVDVSDVLKTYFWNHHTRVNENEEKVNLIAVKYEAICSREAYEHSFMQKYLRPRDVVSSTITSRTKVPHPGSITSPADMIPLRFYWSDGSQTLYHNMARVSKILKATDFEGISEFIRDILKNEATVKFENIHDFEEGWWGTYSCDGVVVSRVKSTKHGWIEIDPDYEVAIKILNNVKETKLKKIDWQYGKTGKITPVAIVDDVKFDNITVNHITLSTFERVINMNLKYNDTVRIVYNIVPYLIESLHDGDVPIPVPTICPICGAALNMAVARNIRCTNPTCNGKKVGDIIRYVEKMRMFGISKKTIERLFDEGLIYDIRDLYNLDYNVIENLDGFGEKSAKNMKATIIKASTNVPIERWLGALPCLDVSAKTWKILLKGIFGNNMIRATNVLVDCIRCDDVDAFLENVLWYVNGVGPATIRNINEGIRTCWDDMRVLVTWVTFANDNPSITKGYVAMTGTRDANLKKELESRGYTVTDTFNNSCMALIVPSHDFTSNKVSKAKRLNTPIYDINEAYDALL